MEVSSFGRRREQPQPPAEQMVDLPTGDQLKVMLVPVVDPEALDQAYTQIRQAVAAAVRAGFSDALDDPGAGGSPAGQ